MFARMFGKNTFSSVNTFVQPLVAVLLTILLCRHYFEEEYFNKSDTSDSVLGRQRSTFTSTLYKNARIGGTALAVGTPSDAAVAVCLAVKNSHEDILEWVEHHVKVGVGRIYLFDNGSIPPLNTTIKDYIDSEVVVYKYSTLGFGNVQTGRKYPQLQIYEKCLNDFGPAHHWMAFLDADEYLILKDGPSAAKIQSLPALLWHLEDFEPFGGLAVSWEVFGSSQHKVRPPGGILKNYWRCLPRNSIHSRHIKTIVNTQYALMPLGPHHFKYRAGFYAIDERFQRINGPILPPGSASVEKIALHHYTTKSLADFMMKSATGSAMGNHKPLSFLTAIDAEATQNCSAALALQYSAPADVDQQARDKCRE